jgi:hypothetical protein
MVDLVVVVERKIDYDDEMQSIVMEYMNLMKYD